LEKALEEISRFGATVLIVSLGLDTYEGDDVAVPKAGFRLQADDYWKMVCNHMFFLFLGIFHRLFIIFCSRVQ